MTQQESAKVDLFKTVVEQFVPLSNDEWIIFKGHLKLSYFKKKELFVRAGDVSNFIGLIVSGSVRYFQVKEGREITGYFSVESEMISSYKSFLTRLPATNNIEALENSEIITLSYNSIQQLLGHEAMALKMERFSRLVAEYLVCCYDDRVTSLIMQSPEERYLDLLAKSTRIIQRIPQHYIANYLGITPVSLSRIRRRIMEPSKDLQQVLS